MSKVKYDKTTLHLAVDFETQAGNDNRVRVVAFSITEIALITKNKEKSEKYLIRDIDKVEPIKDSSVFFCNYGEKIESELLEELHKITSKYKVQRVFLYFHNARGYDSFYLRYILFRQGFKYINFSNKRLPNHSFQEINAKGKILSTTFNYKNKIYKVCDTLNYFQSDLKGLAKTFGVVDKIEIDKELYNIDLEYHQTNNTEDYQLYKRYTIRDTEILRDIVLKVIEIKKWDLSSNITSSGLGEKILENHLGNEDFKHFLRLKKTKKNIDNWFWVNESYYGGYSHAKIDYLFRIIRDVYSLDENSGYPDKMRYELPFGEALNEPPKKCQYATLYRILINSGKVKELYAPIIRNNKKGKRSTDTKFIYQVEEDIIYTLWDFELEWFKEFYTDFQYDIIETKYFRVAPYMSSLINKIYNERAEFKNDIKEIRDILNGVELNEENIQKLINKLLEYGVEEHTLKIILNSLYGKTGQHINQDLTIFTYHKRDILEQMRREHKPLYINKDTNEINLERTKNEEIPYTIKTISEVDYAVKDDILIKVLVNAEYIEVNNDSYIRNNAIASYITAKMRCDIYKGIVDINSVNGAEWIYTDTDSLKFIAPNDKVKEEVFKKFNIHDSELGAWSFDYVGSKAMLIKQEKQYLTFENDEQNFNIDSIKTKSASYSQLDYQEIESMEQLLYKPIIARKKSSVKEESGTRLIDIETDILFAKTGNKPDTYIIPKYSLEKGYTYEEVEKNKLIERVKKANQKTT